MDKDEAWWHGWQTREEEVPWWEAPKEESHDAWWQQAQKQEESYGGAWEEGDTVGRRRAM